MGIEAWHALDALNPYRQAAEVPPRDDAPRSDAELVLALAALWIASVVRIISALSRDDVGTEATLALLCAIFVPLALQPPARRWWQRRRHRRQRRARRTASFGLSISLRHELRDEAPRGR